MLLVKNNLFRVISQCLLKCLLSPIVYVMSYSTDIFFIINSNTHTKITILRAVHKYKDSREQFERRTHKRLIDILNPNQKTVEALMSLDLPAGVEIEIKL